MLSPGQAVGLRMVPMVRDLRFAWEEMPQQILDEQQQKVRESLHAALIGWAQQAGEGKRLHRQSSRCNACIRSATGSRFPTCCATACCAQLLERAAAAQVPDAAQHRHAGRRPGSRRCWACTSRAGAGLTFEVITRRIDDRGGGLARVNGARASGRRPGDAAGRGRVPALLLQHDDDVDRHRPAAGGLRPDARRSGDPRRKSPPPSATWPRKMPTYITLKDVKKRWGHGQEDVFPVAQFEKLWGDMTALPEVDCGYVVVSRAGAGSSSRTRHNWMAGCATGRRRTSSPCATGSRPHGVSLAGSWFENRPDAAADRAKYRKHRAPLRCHWRGAAPRAPWGLF